MTCPFCGAPLKPDFANLFTCETSFPHMSRFRSDRCLLGEKILRLTAVGDAIIENGSVSERLENEWNKAKEMEP